MNQEYKQKKSSDIREKKMNKWYSKKKNEKIKKRRKKRDGLCFCRPVQCHVGQVK